MTAIFIAVPFVFRADRRIRAALPVRLPADTDLRTRRSGIEPLLRIDKIKNFAERQP
jgi:hypothetical protein